MLTKRKLLLACAAALAAFSAQAENGYPTKPIRMVAPYVAGGNSDILARIIGERAGRSLGQSFIVDNKSGAGGSIATADVAKTTPDGYTILLGTSSTHAINPAVYKKLRYDALNDFSPITTLALSDYALVVPATSPYKTIQDLLKARPAKPLQYASNGAGTTSHLASALLGVRMKQEYTHIPYKGSSPAMIDLMGGQVDFLIDNTSTALTNAATGKLRILATTGAQRGAVTKDIPTLREAGVPDYEVVGWWVFVAPQNTPAAIVSRLNQEIIKATQDPEVRKRMADMGNEPFTKTPAETRTFIESEMKKFKAIAEAIHLQLD